MTQERRSETLSLAVLFEDADLVVVSKPAGLSTVHDGNRPTEPDAIELLQASYGEIFIVHRIDRDTSGVLLAARNATAHRHLSAQFEAHSVEKSYQCLVRGHVAWDSTTVDLPLSPNAGRAHRTIVDELNGKSAATTFTVSERFRGLTLVVAEPKQGRRHQIRAHLEHVQNPIACDPLYGDGRPLLLSEAKRGYRPSAGEERPLLNRLALHAESLTFIHPSTGDSTTITAPLASDIEVALKQLRRWARV